MGTGRNGIHLLLTLGIILVGILTASGQSHDLSVSVSPTGSLAILGELVAVEVTVTNRGEAPASAVTVTNTLTTNASVFSVQTSQGTYAILGARVRCDVGTIGPRQGVSIALRLAVRSTGTVALASKVVASGLDANASNNVAQVSFSAIEPTFQSGPRLMISRQGHAAARLEDGRVLIVGGITSTGHTTSAELFDPALGTFTETGSMHTTRDLLTASVLTNGKVLVVGGERAEVFDPLPGLFNDVGATVKSRWGHTATALQDGRVLLAGGFDPLDTYWSPSAEVFDPKNNTVSRVGDMLHGRYFHSAVRLANGRVLVAGGSGAADFAEIFDPVTNRFSATGNMLGANWNLAMSLLHDGRVLVGKPYGPAPNSEIYDPTTGTFEAAGDPSRPVKAETATRLPDGSVLFCPGPPVDLYDITTRSFTRTVPFSSDRTGFTTTLLNDGRVLVVGGSGDTTEILVPWETRGLPEVSIGDTEFPEGNGGARVVLIPVSLSFPMANPVTVYYYLNPGSAESYSGDFDPAVSTVTFPPGATNTYISVVVHGDNDFESDEFFTVNLHDIVNASLGRSQGIATLRNDDPFPSLSVVDKSFSEGSFAGAVSIPVILSASSILPVTVSYATSDSTALAGGDYSPRVGSLTFEPGTRTQFVTLPIVGDIAIEANEAFQFALHSPSNATIARAIANLTIENDDGLPGRLHSFQFEPLTANPFAGQPFRMRIIARDANGGVATNYSRAASFRATSDDLPSWWFDFDEGTLAEWTPLNTGYSPGPYEIVPFDVNSEGVMSPSFSTIPDIDAPPDGISRRVELRGGTVYRVAADFALRYDASDVLEVQGHGRVELGGLDSGWLPIARFPLPNTTYRRSFERMFTAPTNGLYSLTLSVFGYSSDPGFAIYIDDVRIEAPLFSLSTPKFTNGVWEGELQFPGPILGVALHVRDADGYRGTSEHFDVMPQADLQIRSGVYAAVPHAGYPFTITHVISNLGPSTAFDVHVTNTLGGSFSILSASATQGACIVETNKVICSLGEVARSNSVTVTISASSPRAESITNLASVSSEPADATLANNISETAITVGPAVIRPLNALVTEPDDGTTNATLTFYLDYASADWLTVSYATIPGTATAELDFIPVSGHLVFPPGTLSQTVMVPVRGETMDEPTETFIVQLFNPTNAVLSDFGQAGVTLEDNDPPVSIFIADTSVLEGSSGTTQAVFTVSLSAHSGHTVNAAWSTANGTAIASGDYTSVANGAVSFPPGITNRTIAVAVKGNTVNESNESFTVTLRNPVNATLGGPTATATIVNDDAVVGQFDHFGVATIPTPQLVRRPFPVVVTALDAFENIVTNYSGTPVFRARQANNATIPSTGRVLSNFVAGVWTGIITISNPYPSVRITVDDSTEHVGASPEFAVILGYSATLSLPAEAKESDGSLPDTGRLSISIPRTNDVEFTLSSSDSNQLIVPPTVFLPHGQTSATFGLTFVDNEGLDGSRNVTVEAGAADYQTAAATLAIHDNETTSITIQFISPLTEGTGSLTAAGVLTLGGAASADVSVALTSSHPARLTLPSSVVIPAGHSNGFFDVILPDNRYIDGPVAVEVSATVRNWTGATITTVVRDDESTNLTVQLPERIFEGQGILTNRASVTLGGLLATNLTVTLKSSDSSELIVPSTILVSAGQTSAVFSVSAVDDTAFDGWQVVMLEASAPGFAPNHTPITIGDDELHHFQFTPIASHQTSSVPIEITVTAHDIDGHQIDTYQGALTLSGTGSRSNVALTVSGPVALESGGWTGTVAIAYWDRQIRLRANAGAVAGFSNPFDCQPPLVQVIALAGNDVVYDRFRDRLYVSVGAAGGSLSNRIVIVEPNVGVIESSFPAGPEPQHLLLSEDGAELYVACNGSAVGENSIRRFSLLTKAVTLELNMGFHPYYSYARYWATDMAELPGLPRSLAVTKAMLGNGLPTLEIYDDGVLRTNLFGEFNQSYPFTVEAAASNRVYVGTPFTRVNLSANGPQGYDVHEGLLGYPDLMKLRGGRIYTRGGRVFDPETLTIVGYLPVSDWVEPDIAAGRVFSLSPDVTPFTRAWDLVASEISVFFPVDSVRLSGFAGSPGNPIRWGTNGLAFVTTVGQLALVRIPFMPDTAAVDLATIVRTSSGSIDLGSNLTYTVTVSNAGPTVAKSVSILNQLPSGAQVENLEFSRMSCLQSNQTIRCSLPELATGESASLSFSITADRIQTAYTNTVTAVSLGRDPVPSDNGVITITPLVPVPEASIEDATMVEGNIRDAVLMFTVRLSKPSLLPILIGYRTFPASAEAQSDFLPISGEIYFPPGETNQALGVTVRGDLRIEADEVFTVRLEPPQHCVIARDTATGTILSDDGLSGEVHHFEWNLFESATYLGRPIPVEITARDASGQIVTNYQGPISFRSGYSNSVVVNGEFESPSIAPWVTVDAGPTPGPYGLGPADTIGDWNPSQAFLFYPDRSVWDGIRQSVLMTANQNYRIDVDTLITQNLPSQFGGALTARVRINGMDVAEGLFTTRFIQRHLSGSFVASTSGWYVVELLASHSYTSTYPGVYLDNLRIVPDPGEPAVPITPTGAASNGVWHGTIVFAQSGTNVFLEAHDEDGHAGRSQSFAIRQWIDDDADELPDDWELAYFQAIDLPNADRDGDPDQDGVGNKLEWIAGTSPTSQSSHPTLSARIRGKDTELAFEGRVGRRYRIEWSQQLGSDWRTMGPPILGSNSEEKFMDAIADGTPHRFYRLVIER